MRQSIRRCLRFGGRLLSLTVTLYGQLQSVADDDLALVLDEQLWRLRQSCDEKSASISLFQYDQALFER
jgi:hypothetical protein